MGETEGAGPGKAAAAGLTLLAVYFTWVHFATPGKWVPLLDHVNLAIHETGHPVFGLLHWRLNVYGGTAFQLLFPLLFAFEFRRRGAAAGFAFSLLWFGESLLNTAHYMADARAQLLPLVGGGLHDWTEIFSRWGVLRHDTAIARVVQLLSLGVFAATVAWLWLRVLNDADVRRGYRM